MHSMNSSRHGSQGSIPKEQLSAQMQNVPENDVLKTAEHANGYNTPPRTPPADQDTLTMLDHEHDDDEHEDVDIVEPATMHSVQTVKPVSQQVISRVKLVDVPKRVPPKLPPRNPGRNLNGPVVVDASPKGPSPASTSPERPTPSEEAEEPTKKAEEHALPQSVPIAQVDSSESHEQPALVNKLDEVKLDDEDEADETSRPNPWAKVEEAKNLELEYQQLKDESTEAKMPGGFD